MNKIWRVLVEQLSHDCINIFVKWLVKYKFEPIIFHENQVLKQKIIILL